MFEFDMVKLVILLLMGPFIKFDCSRYQCSSERFFFNLKIYGKLAGLSNKFEPSMVFDPSEFEGPRFDLYIWKMLISIFSCFFHTIFKDFVVDCSPLDTSYFTVSHGYEWSQPIALRSLPKTPWDPRLAPHSRQIYTEPPTLPDVLNLC